jgi:alkylation response protein AidB-like acyl-CoA dehydrogenase
MATAAQITYPKTIGGSFLIEDRAPEEIYTPEDLTSEHRSIARTAQEFFKRDVEPHVEEIQHGNHDLAVQVLKKSGELGLLAITTPEKFGGMELDLASALVVAEAIAGDGSYAAWHGAHAGIGTLPLLLFGTEEQKQKYLPKLSTGELVGAYCLTEPHAGSDALAAKTTAKLTEDGRHYMLNGQKMWITNGAKADLYTVFAKIVDPDGKEHFSAFLVDRTLPGVTPGHEERKMGIKGSSTCAIFLDNVPVPVENLLGEKGRGHIIAFNILNVGRLKLGPFAVGGAKNLIAICAKYAKERKAFGTTISEFGVIQHKLAEMAIKVYATEAMVYRTVGAIEALLDDFSWEQPDAARREMKAIEEFAAECSMVKVYASEMLDYVVDEGVQIHGGNGFSQEYAVERAYRDSRINRIFEGTNEINRLLTTGMLLKRAARGQLGLVKAAQGVVGEILSGPSMPLEDAGEPWSAEKRVVANAKKISLLLMGLAFQKYMMELEKQQEILYSLADVIMDVYAMESTLLRTEKMRAKPESIAADICAVLLRESMAHIDVTARDVIAACSDGDSLKTNMAVLRRFNKYEPVNAIEARRRIARRVLDTERYAIA